MALEESRTTRDYLYGRLLAIADQIEGRALYLAGEKRETGAARLMQRFSDRPASTWKTIEVGLTPYKSRLRVSRGGFLQVMIDLMTNVTAAFAFDDFVSDHPLSGEFLLGYHCQRQALRANPNATADSESSPDQ